MMAMITWRRVNDFHGERLREVVLRPDRVLTVGELGEAGGEETSGVAQVDNLQYVFKLC